MDYELKTFTYDNRGFRSDIQGMVDADIAAFLISVSAVYSGGVTISVSDNIVVASVLYSTDSAPTVTTQAVSGITATTAIGNGNITSLGVPNPTAHGVCWAEGKAPTLADSSADEGAAGSTGAFTSAMAGLTASTVYFVRAYATNSTGVVYGDLVTFITSA